MQYSSSIYTWMAKRARNSRYTCVFWIRITWWLGGVSATATSIWTHAVPKSHKNSNSTHGGQQLQVRYYVLVILPNTFIFCNVRMQILKVVNWVGRTDFQNGWGGQILCSSKFPKQHQHRILLYLLFSNLAHVYEQNPR